MPVTYALDPAAKLIRTRCSGHLTLQEVIDHFGRLADDPARPDELDVLLDLAEVESLPEANQLGAVNYVLEAVRKNIRFGVCAIIARRDALYGMMRVFEVTAQDYFRAIRVFREAGEAEAWLMSERP